MAISIKEGQNIFDTVNSVQRPAKIAGVVEGKMNIGDSTTGYIWKSESGESPYISMFPNVGYHVAGFEVDRNLRDSTTHEFSAISNIDSIKSNIGIADVLFHKDDKIDWDKYIVNYKVMFNKNIYNFIIENQFYQKDGKTKIAADSSHIESVRGAKIGFLPTTSQKQQIIYSIKQRGQLTGSETLFKSENVPQNDESKLNEIVGRRLNTTFNNMNPIYFEGTQSQKKRNFSVGDKIVIGAHMDSRLYTFGGWYYIDPKDRNHERLISIKGDNESGNEHGFTIGKCPQIEGWSGKDELIGINLNEDFIKHMVDDDSLTSISGKKPAPIVNMFNDDQITIVAKWNEVKYTATTQAIGGGTVDLNNEPMYPIDVTK